MVAVDPAFWSGRTVLVTGHTGFKGAWLALWLHHLGAHVVGYALDPPTDPSLFETARIAELVRSTRGDVTASGEVTAVIQDVEPEVVFHLAAQSLVRESYLRPLETIAVNVMGTATVLEAVRAAPSVRSVVVVTSDKCYENREAARPYRETDPMGGQDPYSVSKGASELIASAWRRSFLGDIAVATARAGNVIGGGDWGPDRLVPDCVRALAAGETIKVRNPESVRPWQHVLEPLLGYLLLAERGHADPVAVAGGWNFGPAESDARPVAWIADEVARRWGRPDGWVAVPDDGPHEAAMLALDSTHARRDLGWAPRLDIDAALDWTVEWYRGALDHGDARALTLEQIDRFEQRGES